MNNNMYMVPGNMPYAQNVGLGYDPNDTRLWGGFGFRPWGFGFRPWGFGGWGFRPWGFGFPFGGFGFGAPFGFGLGFGFPFFI